jgi:hypothetical protein
LAGEYKGTIKIRSDQGIESVPIAITVYPPEMPDTSHLKTTNWYAITKDHYDFASKYDEKYFKLLEAFINNMADITAKNVTKEGVFRIAIEVTPDNNKIKFTAKRNGSSRTIEREYSVTNPTDKSLNFLI